MFLQWVLACVRPLLPPPQHPVLKCDTCYLSGDETDGIIQDDVHEFKSGLTKYPLDVSHTSVYMSLSGLSCCLKGVPVGGGNTTRLKVDVWWYHTHTIYKYIARQAAEFHGKQFNGISYIRLAFDPECMFITHLHMAISLSPHSVLYVPAKSFLLSFHLSFLRKEGN